MVKLKEIPRTATFAWSPTGSDPLLVTGTVAGAVDADFSSTTQLELWDLSLLDRSPESFDLSPRIALDTSARFYDIAWGGASSDHPHGVIAGALESGALELWDAESLINGNINSFSTQTKHTGAIKCLEFNPLQKNVIATGGVNGEIYIWDLKNLDKAITPGRTPSRQEDVDAIAWNNGVTHILASGSSSGTSVWDLKNRKEVLHLSYTPPGINGRCPVSSIAWHPDNSTTLITASSDENSPVILLWDLRNANSPQQIIQGHEKGVLSMDWCKQDSSLLISSGKDNKTFLWDPTHGTKLGEYPVTSNWNFETGFSAHYPDIFASASFDGKITIQTLQDTNTSSEKKKNVESDDFWNSNNYVDAQHPVVSLKNPPKWLKRPCSVAFGFGGKIVSVKSTSTNSSIVSITNFAGDEAITSETTKFASALQENKISDIISEHLSNTSADANLYDWELLELLNKDDAKTQLKKFLSGSPKEEVTEEVKDTTAPADDDLFESVGGDDFLSTLSISKAYEPSGPFNIYGSAISASEKEITKAVLAGDFEKAVNIALKDESFSDAFALASNASESVRTKVQNAYIAKNAESKPFLRVLAAVSANDLTDLVENSDISEWKDVVDSIFGFAKEESVFKSLASKLGDRLLTARSSLSDASSEEATTLRNNALFCYLAASNLSGASSIWIKEINEQETSLLQASSNTQTPYSAHVKALHGFIEKVTIFRTAAKPANESEKGLDQLYDAYREYANIVATQGQLDLAETYLNLLPSQYPGANLEKERVLKANKKAVNKANPSTFVYPKVKQTTAFPATSLYTAPAASSPYARQQPASSPYAASQPLNSTPYSQPAAAAASPYAPAQPAPSPYAPVQSNASPYAPQQPSLSQPPSAYAPPAQSTLAPPPNTGPSPSPVSASFSKPARQGHARTASGIYPPSNPIINTFQPPKPAGYGNSTVPAPPAGAPPGPKREAGGWNDLPTAALPQSSKRATSTASQTIANPFANQSQPFTPPGPQGFGRQTPVALAPPPSGPPTGPPTGPPGTSESISSQNDVSASAPPINPYAPKAESPSMRKNSYGSFSQTSAPDPSYFPAAPAAPPVNPYAAAPPSNPYAAAPPSNPYAAAPPSNPYSAAPPSNPYAAAPPSNPYAAAPPSNSYAAAPPSNSYAPGPGATSSPGQANMYAPPQGLDNSYAQHPQTYPSNGPPMNQVSAQQPPAPPVEPPVEETPKFPPGDRSHISSEARPIYELLEQELNKVKPQIPETYKRQVDDIEKRLGILFDHLNNDDLLSAETVTDLIALSQALAAGDYDTASEIRLAVLTTRVEECGQWMAGVKRLIDMSRVIASS